MSKSKQYIWHSETGTLLPQDECMVVTLTEAEAELVRSGAEEPSDKLARIIQVHGVKR